MRNLLNTPYKQKASKGSLLTMASLRPMRTKNPNACHNTSVTKEPRRPPILPPSLVSLCMWSERVIGASLDVWSMFPTQMQIDAVISLIDVDVCGGKVLLIVKTGALVSGMVAGTVGALVGSFVD